MVNLLNENWINPFDTRNTDLVSLSTGVAATPKIVEDLEKAKYKGENEYQKFKTERLENRTVKFNDTLHKQSLQTFANLKKKGRSVKVNGHELMLKADKNLFSKIIMTAQTTKQTMQEVLQYPLGPIPWALAQPDGLPRKTAKSSLGRELVKNVPLVDSIPAPCACIIDAMAVLNRMKFDKFTFQDIVNSLWTQVLGEAAGHSHVDVVFDTYKHQSIKEVECGMRASQDDPIIYRQILASTRIAKWSNFLLSVENKNNLITFIVEKWKSETWCEKLQGKDLVMYVTCHDKCFKITTEKEKLLL